MKKKKISILLWTCCLLCFSACGRNNGAIDTVAGSITGNKNTVVQGEIQKSEAEEGTAAEKDAAEHAVTEKNAGKHAATEENAEEYAKTEEGIAGEADKVDLTVSDAYEQILNSCTREFIGGYTIDDTFLSWLAANYEEDLIFRLAEAVRAGELEKELWYELTGCSIHVLWNMYCRDTGFQSYCLENVYWKNCASDEKVVLDFIGDINFAEDWSTIKYLDKQVDGLYDCLSEALLQELNQADILMVNNEFVYSRGGTPLEGKDYTFRADPDRVYLLEIMGTDMVSLANNHAYDYGAQGLLDTIKTLKDAKIPYVGAGSNLQEAMQPGYFIANGRKIAIVSATQIERSLNYTKEATDTSPGVLKTLNPEKFLTVIEEAEENADYVIVYVHWGTEQNEHFEKDQTALADAYIEAGADAIIGGHTHCLQGCEYRKNVPIIYSLGNFWFNSNKLDTGVAQLVIHEDGRMDFRFLPCVQKKNETYLVEDAMEKQRILDYMESISAGITIDEDGYIMAAE